MNYLTKQCGNKDDRWTLHHHADKHYFKKGNCKDLPHDQDYRNDMILAINRSDLYFEIELFLESTFSTHENIQTEHYPYVMLLCLYVFFCILHTYYPNHQNNWA